MEKHFGKEFVMTKKYNEHSENFAKSWIFDNDYDLDSDVKVRDRFYISTKYRGSAHRGFNIQY